MGDATHGIDITDCVKRNNCNYVFVSLADVASPKLKNGMNQIHSVDQRCFRRKTGGDYAL